MLHSPLTWQQPLTYPTVPNSAAATPAAATVAAAAAAVAAAAAAVSSSLRCRQRAPKI
jgi:hypothetical protein